MLLSYSHMFQLQEGTTHIKCNAIRVMTQIDVLFGNFLAQEQKTRRTAKASGVPRLEHKISAPEG